MYKLMIKNGEVWHTADLPADVSICSTFEEAGIAEMSLKGNGTQEIELPCSVTNKTIFEHIENPLVNTDISYRKLECRLFNDSLEIFGAGSYCIILRANAESIVVSIVGGSYDVFTALKNIDFTLNRDIFGSIRRPSLNTANESITTEANGIIKYWYNNKAISTAMIPIELIKSALELQTGYALSDSIFRSGYYLSLTDRKRGAGQGEREYYDRDMVCKEEYIASQRDRLLELYYVSEEFSSNSNKSLLPTNVTGVGLTVRISVQFNNTSYQDAVFEFTLQYAGVLYKLTYTLNGTAEENGFVSAYEQKGIQFIHVYSKTIIYWSDGTVTDEAGMSIPGAQGFIINEITPNPTEIWWGYNDYVRKGLSPLPGSYNYAPNYPEGCVQCHVQPMISHTNKYSEAYGEIYVAENMGYKNALELYKALATTFAQITHVENNVAHAYSIADVVRGKASAANWSKKVFECEDSFRASEYARRNAYSFKEDEEYGIVVEKVINSPDVNLEEQKRVEIALLSGDSIHGVAIYQYNEEGKIELRTLAAPYLLRFISNQFVIASADEMQDYNTIEEMLSKWKSVSANVLLSPLDIMQFDHRVPVYIEKYGAYFYVRKISNWESGRECSVELIRI